MENWLTLYSDSIVHDDARPQSRAPRHAAINPGIYLSHPPKLPHVDLRAEAVSTDPENLAQQEASIYLLRVRISGRLYEEATCSEVG